MKNSDPKIILRLIEARRDELLREKSTYRILQLKKQIEALERELKKCAK